MEIKIIKENDVKEFDNNETKVKDLFISDFPDISIAKIDRNSKDKTFDYDEISDNFYYVLDGKGTCVTKEEEFKLEKGDLIVIPKKTKYKNIGNIKLLAISIPKFNENNQIYEK